MSYHLHRIRILRFKETLKDHTYLKKDWLYIVKPFFNIAFEYIPPGFNRLFPGDRLQRQAIRISSMRPDNWDDVIEGIPDVQMLDFKGTRYLVFNKGPIVALPLVGPLYKPE